MKQTIVAIEDEPDLLAVLQYNLTREGFRVESAKDGDEGLELIGKLRPDLILLDLMLPGMDGLEICRRVKYDAATRHIPIIIVSAKGEEGDVILGLELGADDYITKPFSPRELLARVRAVLRRGSERRKGSEPVRLSYGGLTIDPLRYQVVVESESVDFTATEFRLLYFLASHPGRVFTREQLIRNAVGEDVVILERNIDVHVRAMRRKLGARAGVIETIRGVGYRFADAPTA
ncbi:MAG TPA: response regulator transcription factor [Candidatus Krumholzibacteria bacterium]|jgi:two-component system phosphate regulon response regulator PhoB